MRRIEERSERVERTNAWRRRHWRVPVGALLVMGGALATLDVEVGAQTDPPVPPPLSTVPVPEPTNLGDFVRDRAKAIVLGKALFWEMQIGSDAIQSCASCHFQAGADNRAKNQLSPGLLRVDGNGNPAPDEQTDRGHNATLTAADFPFRLLANPNDRNSTVLRDTNDIAGSQGVTFRKFLSVIPGVAIDVTAFEEDPDGFEVSDLNTRRVDPRHTPTVINAVFNHRNFWDGRAQNEFNGVNPLGDRDPHARVWRSDHPNQAPLAVAIRLANASLASQAVGPPTSKFEMSADGRTFVDIGAKFAKPWRDSGKKLKALRPLAQQEVHPQDSVLGPYSRSPDKGLTYSRYDQLVREAFHDRWWSSQWKIQINSDGSRTPCQSCSGDKVYTQEEMNFSLFFGLSVALYEATLVSDDTPFDRFAAGDTTAMSAAAQRGLALFRSQTRGRCINCHAGPELTNASVRSVTAARFRRREGNFIDMGFNNIGVRPTTEDLAVGGNDELGKPLSEARLVFRGELANPNPPPQPGDVLGVDGAFKVPGLRNVELTAPYFHNGGTLTLRQVMDFYSRGGDFVPIRNLDGTTISPLNTPNFTEQEKDDLVAFMLALTDDRVKFRRAPFDHPELKIPNGHPGSEHGTHGTLFEPGQAADDFKVIPAVGAQGGPPLPLFPAP
jgi:cytochrome c peroxidase